MAAPASRCPTCDKPAPPRPANPFAPFCGERCQIIDLGRWLDGAYRIPAEDQTPPADDGDGDE